MTWTQDRYSEYVNASYSTYNQSKWNAIIVNWSNFSMSTHTFTHDVFSAGVWTADTNTITGGTLIKGLTQFGQPSNETLGDNSGGTGNFNEG